MHKTKKWSFLIEGAIDVTWYYMGSTHFFQVLSFSLYSASFYIVLVVEDVDRTQQCSGHMRLLKNDMKMNKVH